MTNTAAIGMEGLDTDQIRDDSNKVSEEAIKQIQEQAKQAKQAQKDIKDDKGSNQNLAQFLSFLFKHPKNEKLTKLMYEAFFKVKHPQSNIVYLRKTINTKVIVGVFVPFYPEQTKEYNLVSLYDTILPQGPITDIEQFIIYLQKLSTLYHDKIPVNKETFMQFLIELTTTYIPVYTDKESHDRRQLIQQDISKYLYNKE